MSTALSVVPQGSQAASLANNYNTDRVTNVQRLGSLLAGSGYFSDMKDAAQAAVKVMAGEELGIAPVAAVMGIHIIKGKVSLSANLIAAQVRRHGYDYQAKFASDGCTINFIGKKGEALGDSSFTEADAKTAGVYGDMYKKFPRNMYFSRAMSNGAKWYCPEVMSGMPIYTPEELGATVDSEGDVIHEEKPIDTGGHPTGTKAAADHVANQKLEGLRQQSAARAQERQQPPPQPKQAETIQSDIPADVLRMWAQMKDMKGTLEVFAKLKSQLCEALGQDSGERMYYGILGKEGVEHANQFKSTKPARTAARELLDALNSVQQEPVVGDDALPDFGGPQ